MSPTRADDGHTTTREQFRHLAAEHRVVPVVRKVLADAETPLSAYQKLAAGRPGTFLLESAEHGRSWSRWSFIGAGSPAALTVVGGEAAWSGEVPSGAPSGGDPVEALRQTLELLATEHLPGLPPLTGGLVGYLGYDLVRRFTEVPEIAADDLGLPEMVLLLATELAAVDHHEGAITLIANAVNWDGSDSRVDGAYDEAVARLDAMTAALAAPAASTVAVYDRPEPQYRRTASANGFEDDVRDLIAEVTAGRAEQVVVSQRFEMDTGADPLDVYRILRASNPSPYMFLVQVPAVAGGEPFAIVGSSPEALLQVSGGVATTHPIGGTRPRGADEESDLLLEKELLADEKENTEHDMLVELAKHDLAAVCDTETIAVRDYAHIERYSHVMHLVSTVSGHLADGRTALDAIAACFPAGTLSGAPKAEALRMIEEREPFRRGVYGGVVGYLDFAGGSDTAIAIRTAVMRAGTAYVQAGAGVVAESDPATEEAETRNKASAVLRAIAAAETLRPVGSAGGGSQ